MLFSGVWYLAYEQRSFGWLSKRLCVWSVESIAGICLDVINILYKFLVFFYIKRAFLIITMKFWLWNLEYCGTQNVLYFFIECFGRFFMIFCDIYGQRVFRRGFFELRIFIIKLTVYFFAVFFYKFWLKFFLISYLKNYLNKSLLMNTFMTKQMYFTQKNTLWIKRLFFFKIVSEILRISKLLQ